MSRFFILILIFALLFVPVAAQTPPEGVPVHIDSKEVLRIRKDLAGLSAEERAEAVRNRILAAARARSGAVVKMEIREEAGLPVIFADGQLIVAVGNADATAVELTPAQLADLYSRRIGAAIEEYRSMRTWRFLLVSGVKAVGAWTIFIVVIVLLLRAFDWITNRIKMWFASLTARAVARGILLLLWERLLLLVLALVKLAAAVFVLVQFSVLLTYTFSLFPATQGISVSVIQYVLDALGNVGNALLHYLPSGIFVTVVIFVAYYILQASRIVFLALERGDIHWALLAPDMAPITFQIFRVAMILLTLIVVFPYLPGSQSDAFKGVSIFLGILLSLGSGSAVSNVLAGVVLTYMRPYRVGDFVKVAEQLGEVREKGLLVTRLRTIKNVEVTIPNASILGAHIQNYSALARDRGLILHTTVTIGYDAPWRRVHELLIDAALATEGILPQPRPFVLQTSLNDFHISYEINAYTNRPNDMIDIYSRLHSNIQEKFNEGGVEIMSPTFLALRDGNTVTIPEAQRHPDYKPPSFLFKQGE